MPGLPDRLNLNPEDMRSYTGLLNLAISPRQGLASQGYYWIRDDALISRMKRNLQMIILIGRRNYNRDDQMLLTQYLDKWHSIYEFLTQ
ncbi:hypothetical protein CAEBREN_01692 [Caenorhabditis brenneri]|uniref:Uncharacterized protein n=1 Tax=Caenorhabditis brenneri TaxID=135651 RepID=G0MH77_CAEBE|nr:hypothetical protein CAEBREN_01692 [Caenorhabditis brenneri]